MWSVVMFDLPTGTKQERHEAQQFRMFLFDHGFQMTQFSVYVLYTPTTWGCRTVLEELEQAAPQRGKVRILNVSDRQWRNSFHVCDGDDDKEPGTPGVLTLF